MRAGYNPLGDPIDMCLAAPAKVLEVSEKTVLVDYNGVRTTARLDALPDEVSPGDYVLIHTGFAIRRLSPEDGEETLRLFDELAYSLASEAPADLEHHADTPRPDANVPSEPDERKTQ